MGKFNKNILKKIGKKIKNEDIILTNERREHIISRHIDAYKEIKDKINEVVNDADYILEDINNTDTLLIIKQIRMCNDNFIIIIKLNTNEISKRKYNSILTLWKIRNRNLKKQLKKHKLIYSKNVDINE